MNPIIIFIIIASVALAVPIYLLISPRLTERYCSRKIAETPEDSAELIPKLLKAFLPGRCVFTDISLPIPGRDGEEIGYGTVAVCRGGIFIISKICGEGFIENPPGAEKWKFMNSGSVKEFPNPFKQQESPRQLLSFYASAAGENNVRIHTLIVYTDKRLRFSNPPSKGIIHVSQLYKRIQMMSARGKLTGKGVRAIAKLINDANDGLTDITEQNK